MSIQVHDFQLAVILIGKSFLLYETHLSFLQLLTLAGVGQAGVLLTFCRFSCHGDEESPLFESYFAFGVTSLSCKYVMQKQSCL